MRNSTVVVRKSVISLNVDDDEQWQLDGPLDCSVVIFTTNTGKQTLTTATASEFRISVGDMTVR